MLERALALGVALLVRTDFTDFTDDATWAAVVGAVRAPQGPEDFLACVETVEDPALDGAAPGRLLDQVGRSPQHYFVFVADAATMRDPEHPLLVMDLGNEPGRMFRAVPATVQSIENNLSISNMDFHEFADNAELDGVFRGF